jgi:hypothetical protein
METSERDGVRTPFGPWDRSTDGLSRQSALVEASLQQARRGERRLRDLLMGDSTGHTYLDMLVRRFLRDKNQEPACFSRAGDSFQTVAQPVESAREAL